MSMQLKVKEFDKILNKLTTVFEIKKRSTGDKQVSFYLNNNFVFWTKRSHGSGDIHPRIVSRMMKQFYLKESDFRDLKDCPLSAEDYKKKLEMKGVI